MTGAPDIKADLRLRPEPPRVTRLSRRVLIGLGGVSAVAIVAALFWALDVGRRGNQQPTELYSTDHRAPADGLADLPKDYTGVPKLGPPLPGDWGAASAMPDEVAHHMRPRFRTEGRGAGRQIRRYGRIRIFAPMLIRHHRQGARHVPFPIRKS